LISSDSAARGGSRLFQASSAGLVFCAAVWSSNGERVSGSWRSSRRLPGYHFGPPNSSWPSAIVPHRHCRVSRQSSSRDVRSYLDMIGFRLGLDGRASQSPAGWRQLREEQGRYESLSSCVAFGNSQRSGSSLLAPTGACFTEATVAGFASYVGLLICWRWQGMSATWIPIVAARLGYSQRVRYRRK
jgi:hypothetical protein